ncbi:MAG: hypothetical protein WBC92_17205 [Terracidiphilus sp.]
MRMRFLNLALVVAAILLSPIGNVEACGPDFEPDVFVSTNSPDNLASFATGQLGILQAGYDSNEYAVAFRYLNGGALSQAERQAYVPQPAPQQAAQDWRNLTPAQIAAAQEAQKQAVENAQPAGQWEVARAKQVNGVIQVDTQPAFPTDYAGNIVFDENYLDCPEPAFQNAKLTLSKRAAVWGGQSPWLADWIRAQDAVFSNCVGKSVNMPAPAPAGSPALLRADRAYQIASATFYAKQFDQAAQQFAAIAADKNSPWNVWGQYLAARATVRKAFAMGKATDPYSSELASYDPATMRRAQQVLEAALAQPNPQPSRSIVQNELNFIRIRTEPEKRAAEISAALAGPAPDPNFSQDLQDLSWILVKQIKIQNPPPLLAWIAAWRGSGTAAFAFATWQQSHALPWLVMAVSKARPSDPFAPDLAAEAAKIPPQSPAYDTVFYHRVRLLIGLKRTDEARALLDAALPALRRKEPSSALNALLGERMAVARSFSEFLQFAPRTVLQTGSEGAEDVQGQCMENPHAKVHTEDCTSNEHPLEFDEDAAVVLNRQTSLNMLIDAGASPALTPNLRQNLAVVAWLRSVLLEDQPNAARSAPLLPKPLSQAVGTSFGFPADLAILRNPGLRPYLEAGVPRVASFSYFDEFRNNWWCKPWNESDEGQSPKPGPLPTPAFATPEQEKLADAEYQRLQQQPDSAALIGQRVIDYANQHPNDPQVPEALALTVRATHFACQTWSPNLPSGTKPEYTPVSKAAFELLHRSYPKSPWTAKTPYYY